jgi:hypothetical protein
MWFQIEICCRRSHHSHANKPVAYIFSKLSSMLGFSSAKLAIVNLVQHRRGESYLNQAENKRNVLVGGIILVADP